MDIFSWSDHCLQWFLILLPQESFGWSVSRSVTLSDCYLSLCRRLWTVTKRPWTTGRHISSKSFDQHLLNFSILFNFLKIFFQLRKKTKKSLKTIIFDFFNFCLFLKKITFITEIFWIFPELFYFSSFGFLPASLRKHPL